jgi:hypothetical protein
MLSIERKVIGGCAILILLMMYSRESYNAPLNTRIAESLPVEHACEDAVLSGPSSAAAAKPLIILISGGARTGTTYLYNLVRILLRQVRP